MRIYLPAERRQRVIFLLENRLNKKHEPINMDYRELPFPLSKKEAPRLPVKEILSIAVWVVMITMGYIVINMYG